MLSELVSEASVESAVLLEALVSVLVTVLESDDFFRFGMTAIRIRATTTQTEAIMQASVLVESFLEEAGCSCSSFMAFNLPYIFLSST